MYKLVIFFVTIKSLATVMERPKARVFGGNFLNALEGSISVGGKDQI